MSSAFDLIVGIGLGVAMCVAFRLGWRRLRLRRAWHSFKDQLLWSLRYAPRHYLVLDVGSGHNPHIRADVLCEKYLEDDIERGGTIVTERPLVIGDANALPFRDKAFDLVISRHMIEHLPDPRPFFENAGRVAQRGYFTAPSAVAEKLMSYPFHRWLIELRDGVVHFQAKQMPVYDGAIQAFFANILGDLSRYDDFMLDHLHALEVRYRWEDAPRCSVDGVLQGDAFVQAHVTPGDDVVKRTLSGVEDLRNRFKTVIRRLTHAIVSKHHHVDLASLLACPRCLGEVQLYSERVHCPACALDYPVHRGIPIMLIERAVPSAGSRQEQRRDVGAGVTERTVRC